MFKIGMIPKNKMLDNYSNKKAELTSKISKPAISRTPIKKFFLSLVSRVSLHMSSTSLKSFSNILLHRALILYFTWDRSK